MQRHDEQRERFGLTWAIAASVVLHVLFLLFFWVLPFRAAVVEPEPEETTLQFTFAPVETEMETQPKGDIPVPVEQPTPPSRPVAEAQVPTPADLPPPPPEESAPEQAAEATPEDEPSGLDLPSEGTEREGETRTPEPREQPAPQEKTFDMENALRDFGRAMSQPRPESDNRGTTVTELPQLPATGFGFGNLEFESRDFDWSDYARQIYMAIWRAWHNRLYVTAEAFERWGYENRGWALRHGSAVRFTIQRNGSVTDIALETPSGCYPLDDSAMDALAEVILPPLPQAFPRQQETVHARFIAEGDVRTMRKYLGQLKRAGYF